jgi:hypothetical protein
MRQGTRTLPYLGSSRAARMRRGRAAVSQDAVRRLELGPLPFLEPPRWSDEGVFVLSGKVL